MSEVKMKEETVRVALSEVFVDHSWNSRSGGWMQQATEIPKDEKGNEIEGPGGSTGLAGLVLSIKSNGQDQACDVRPNPGKTKHKYMLVTGFRRFEALRRIAESGVIVPGFDPKNPTVKVNVRNLTEAEARALNGRENIERDDLSPADTAWHISQLAETHKLTDTAIAAQIGKTQGYVSKLHRIMKETKADILKAWRENPIDPLTIEQRIKLAEYPKDGQEAAFKALLTNAGGGKGKKGAWVKAATEKATNLGVVFGALEREGVITLNGRKAHLVLPTFGAKYLGAKKPTDGQWEKLRDAFSEGREMGLKPPVEEPSKEDKKAAAEAS